MNTGAYIENSVNVICFTALAIAFDHWWIVLFSLLFLNFPRKKDENHDE